MTTPEDPRPDVPATEPAIEPEERPTAAGFSRWLRTERELRGLSVEEVVRTTRLAANVIEGLESGAPERMPPAGYLKGYLRTYAGALGLDADDVVLRWQEVEAAERGEEDEEEPPPPPLWRAIPLVPTLVTIALVIAAMSVLLRGLR